MSDSQTPILVMDDVTTREEAVQRGHGYLFPMGTLMPFFHNDASRTWVVIPEMISPLRIGIIRGEPSTSVTKNFVDVCALIDLVIALITEYLPIWQQSNNKAAVWTEIMADKNFQALVAGIESFIGLRHVYKFKNFYHPLICFLLTTAYNGGIPQLMARKTQLTNTGFSFDTTYDPQLIVTPYPKEAIEFGVDGAYSGYNWELF